MRAFRPIRGNEVISKAEAKTKDCQDIASQQVQEKQPETITDDTQVADDLRQMKPKFRIAYTNDGCLILMDVHDGFSPIDIELDVEQTRDLVNFVSAMDLEARP